jgi:hypothetical protein
MEMVETRWTKTFRTQHWFYLNRFQRFESTYPVEAIEGLVKTVRASQNAKKGKAFFGMGS